MEPPESSKPTSNSNEPVPVQDSLAFSYFSNASPIQPVRAPQLTRGLPGINSPPLVFTSPLLNTHEIFHGVNVKQVRIPWNATVTLSQEDFSCKNSVSAVDEFEKLDIQCGTKITVLITHKLNISKSNSNPNDQIESPTEAPDRFLTDFLNMDSVDGNISSESSAANSQYVDQPPDTTSSSKESVVKLEDKHNVKTNDKIIVPSSAITSETEELPKEETLILMDALERDETQRDGVSDYRCLKIENELPKEHALTNWGLSDTMFEVEVDPPDQPSPLLSHSTQSGGDNVNFLEDTGAALSGVASKNVPNDSERQGMHRRYLQFEDAQHKAMSYQTALSPSDSENPKSLSLEIPSEPVNRNQADMTTSVLPSRSSLNPTVKIPKPSGIGLHLNSIINSVQAGSYAVLNVKSAQRVNFCIRGTKSAAMSSPILSDNSTALSSPLSEIVSAGTNGKGHENHDLPAANSGSSFTAGRLKPSSDSDILNSLDGLSTPGIERKFNTENDGSDKFNKSSPKKKRKKPPDSDDVNDCKRCNCKRSKCLKLYCECFAAGIYCAEPCACQGCFNKPEYEDTVLGTRQQIESRNPLAFAPKVVQHIIEPPATSFGEDGTHFTPSSARHKRGCNCKKSTCLKKYCECYQANVGCSDGCRCEGCKNIFGKREEYGISKDVFTKKDASEKPDGSLAAGTGLEHTELYSPHELTPTTPAFQFSNHGKYGSNAWFSSGKYNHSAESALTFQAPFEISPCSPRNLDYNGLAAESTQGNLDLVSFDQDLDYGTAETVKDYSTPSDQHSKRGLLPGVSNPPPEWIYNSHAQSQCYPGNAGRSHCWPFSPNTPANQCSGTKLLPVVEFGDELSNLQDDTPDILKDTPATTETVKVSSPNKKRVSPPHGRALALGSSSSTGLRTCRKFILHAVSEKPDCTPCVDSKTNGALCLDSERNEVQQTNDSLDCYGNNRPPL